MSTTVRSSVKAIAVTQAEKRRGIDVGPRMGQVSTAMSWYKGNHFASEDEARGAFRLAYQQGMDGMGTSVQDWMGLTDAQFDDWMRGEVLPKR